MLKYMNVASLLTPCSLSFSFVEYYSEITSYD